MTKEKPSKTKLLDVYWHEDATLAEAANMFGVSVSTIIRWIEAYGLPKKGRGKRQRKIKSNPEVKNMLEIEHPPVQLKHCWCGNSLPEQERGDIIDCECGMTFHIY